MRLRHPRRQVRVAASEAFDRRFLRRRRRHEASRVRMLRLGEERRGLVLLDHAALLHHGDALAVVRGEAEIVRDQDHRHAALTHQADEQVHHVLLRRHVEAGRRLIGQQQLRTASDRHGDHHPLAHPARELVRVAQQALLGVAELHRAQKLDRPGVRLGARQAEMSA
jgi:hypothetical protein